MTVTNDPSTPGDRGAAEGELARLARVLQLQIAASRATPYPSLQQRRAWLDRAIGLLVDQRQAIEDAIRLDFGNRANAQTGMIDLLASINNLKDAKKNLPRWMKPEKRKTAFPFNVLGGRSYVFYQPLGVVGVVTPWNAPIAPVIYPSVEHSCGRQPGDDQTAGAGAGNLRADPADARISV